MINFHKRDACAALFDRKNCPILSNPEQRAHRDSQDILPLPDRDVDDHTIIMAEA